MLTLTSVLVVLGVIALGIAATILGVWIGWKFFGPSWWTNFLKRKRP